MAMLTKDSECQIGFLKLLWEHGKPDPNFQVAWRHVLVLSSQRSPVRTAADDDLN